MRGRRWGAGGVQPDESEPEFGWQRKRPGVSREAEESTSAGFGVTGDDSDWAGRTGELVGGEKIGGGWEREVEDGVDEDWRDERHADGGSDQPE